MRNPCAGITRFRFYGSNLSPPTSEHPLASSLLTGGKGIKKVWNRQNILRKNPAATIRSLLHAEREKARKHHDTCFTGNPEQFHLPANKL